MPSRRLLIATLSAIAFALAPAGAPATTLIPFTDTALVDRAPVILVGRVEGQLPNTTGEAVTDWLVTVERVLKGEVDGGALDLRVPGGETPDGDLVHIYGAPSFRPGTRALFLLRPRGDGSWRLFQLAQGVFYAVRAQGRLFAAQNLSEVSVVGSPRRGREASRTLRDFDRFVAWIEDHLAGDPRDPDYFGRVSRSGLRAITAEFTLLTWNGLHARWFEFDRGQQVLFRTSGVQAGLPSGGVAELTRALGNWNAEPTTPLQLANAGASSATGGWMHPDEQNTVLFNDPNDEVDDLDCQGAGYLAIGGWRTHRDTAFFNGENYYVISEGDVVMNNGLECYIRQVREPSKWIEALITHEIGHTLGIGHSSENPNEPNAALRNAVMYYRMSWSAPNGGRLTADDIKALQALYRPPKPLPPGACPPNVLCLQHGRFEVTATWRNQFNGLQGTAGAIRASDVAGYFYFTDPKNYELIFKMLDFGSVVKVFYGELTNLQFTITVRDKHTGAVKTYSNTAGDCGGLDENGFVSGAMIARFARSVHGRHGRAQAGTCHADADTMCLLNNRFAVEMSWRNQYDGSSGAGKPKKLSDLTGAFGFTDTANLELLVKTLDFGNHVLVLYGALSNLEYDLRVTDTLSGRTKTYSNPAGRYCGGLDDNF
jgi:hypothetical protein